MFFKNYNDYEILYLIKEGNEVALSILFEKYEIYIWKMAHTFCRYNEKIDDLVQEGRIVLYTCIKAYNAELKISFFSFFSLCMKREFVRQLDSEYFKEFIHLEEREGSTQDYSKGIVYTSESLFDNKEDNEMYKFVILDGMSLRLYAEKKHLPYGRVYYRYAQLIDKLKEMI